jgi:hypothetical protein
MTKQPVKNWIPDYSDRPEILQTLGRLADLLQEVLQFGACTFTDAWEKSPGTGKSLPPFMLARHVFELLDAVSHSVRHASVEPCNLLLRGMLEACLQLEYMLKEDTQRRALAFLVCEKQQEIKFLKRIDPDTQTGKGFRESLKKDNSVNQSFVFTWDSFAVNAKRRVKKLQDDLASDIYREANEEYCRCRKRNKGGVKWYNFFDGPRSFQCLAYDLGKIAYYDIFYRQWSGLVHASDVILGKVGLKDRYLGIDQLRNPQHAQDVVLHAVRFGLWTIKFLVKTFTPEQVAASLQWHKNKIEPHVRELSTKRIFKTS